MSVFNTVKQQLWEKRHAKDRKHDAQKTQENNEKQTKKNELHLVPSGIQPFAVFVALLLQHKIRNLNSAAVFLIIRFLIYVLGCI